jgi:uncharacterized coiled-coil protein SlyX
MTTRNDIFCAVRRFAEQTHALGTAGIANNGPVIIDPRAIEMLGELAIHINDWLASSSIDELTAKLTAIEALLEKMAEAQVALEKELTERQAHEEARKPDESQPAHD